MRIHTKLWHLLAIVLVASVACSWFASQRRLRAKSTRALQVIREFGGDIAAGYSTESIFRDYAPGGFDAEPSGTTGIHIQLAEPLEPLLERKQLGEALAALPNLVLLGFVGMPVKDADLSIVEELEGVRYLDLSGTAVRDNGLSHLRGCRKLIALDLSYTEIERDLSALTELPDLKRLNLSGTKLTNNALKSLFASDVEISELDLSFIDLSDSQMEWLDNARNLRRLDVQYTDISDVAIERISAIATLESLSLCDVEIKRFPENLRVLRLGKTDTITLGRVAQLPCLEELTISTAGLAADALATISQLSVVKLHLVDCELMSDTVAALGRMPNLESLVLEDVRVAIDVLLPLAESELQTVVLKGISNSLEISRALQGVSVQIVPRIEM